MLNINNTVSFISLKESLGCDGLRNVEMKFEAPREFCELDDDLSELLDKLEIRSHDENKPPIEFKVGAKWRRKKGVPQKYQLAQGDHRIELGIVLVKTISAPVVQGAHVVQWTAVTVCPVEAASSIGAFLGEPHLKAWNLQEELPLNDKEEILKSVRDLSPTREGDSVTISTGGKSFTLTPETRKNADAALKVLKGGKAR